MIDLILLKSICLGLKGVFLSFGLVILLFSLVGFITCLEEGIKSNKLVIVMFSSLVLFTIGAMLPSAEDWELVLNLAKKDL